MKFLNRFNFVNKLMKHKHVNNIILVHILICDLKPLTLKTTLVTENVHLFN